MIEFQNWIVRHIEWSRFTFGEGKKTLGVTRHIEKEIAEIRAQPDDLEEWIDVMILAIDGAWRTGASPAQIIEALKAKQAKNFDRKWPAPVSDDLPVEHIRE